MSNKGVLASAPLVYCGALYGFLGWMAYGLAEFAIGSAAPLLARSNAIFTPWDWQLTAVLFGVFAAAGLASGAVAGLVIERLFGKASSLIPEAVALTLALASMANLLAAVPWEIPERIALAASLVLTGLLLYTASSKERRRRWGALSNPWVVSAALLLPPMVSTDLLPEHPAWLQATAAGALLLAIVLASRTTGRLLRLVWPDDGGPAVFRHVAVLLVIAVPVLGSAVMLNRNLQTLLDRANFGAAVGGHPNVILITLDTVQASHLSLYGYHRETTPELAKFAQQATVFTQAIASSDMTLPTHASIFTGLYPREHGAHTDPPMRARPLAGEFETLAEILAAKGYTTLAVAANRFYLQPEWGLAQGFHLFDSQAPIRLFNEKRRFFLREGARNLLDIFVSTYAFDVWNRRAEEINRDVFTLLDKVKREGRSFFLFANYMDAHTPYVPPSPYDTLFPGKDRKLTFPRYQKLEREVVTLKHRVGEREREHLLSQYDGGIAYMDTHVSRLIEQLKEMGLYDNTLLIITGDHGEAFGERNLIEHAVSVYQNQVHIPLIIKYPHQEQGAVVDSLASQVDLLPTILDVLGDPVPKELRGIALNRKQAGSPRDVISSSFPSVIFYDVPRLHHRQWAIYSGPMKFITSTAGKRELYNLSEDPQETKNLYNPDSETVTRLQSGLNEWLKEVNPHAAVKRPLRPENLQRLKSLGYVQ